MLYMYEHLIVLSLGRDKVTQRKKTRKWDEGESQYKPVGVFYNYWLSDTHTQLWFILWIIYPEITQRAGGGLYRRCTGIDRIGKEGGGGPSAQAVI